MATKLEIVEDALLKYKTLESIEICQLIYTTNPQKYIEKLRKKYGADAIETEMHTSKKVVMNRFGKKLTIITPWAKYIWRGNNEEEKANIQH